MLLTKRLRVHHALLRCDVTLNANSLDREDASHACESNVSIMSNHADLGSLVHTANVFVSNKVSQGQSVVAQHCATEVVTCC